MDPISCYCTPDQKGCDPITRKVVCKPDQRHCLLSLKQIDDNSSETYLQGCWYWHSSNDVLFEEGVCYIISDKIGYVSCCCKGDSCNVPNIPIKPLASYIGFSYDNANRSLDSHTYSSKGNTFTSLSNSPMLLYATTIPLIILLLIVFVFIFLLYRRCKKSSNLLVNSAVGDSPKLGTDKHKSFVNCRKLFPASLRLCFTRNHTKNDGQQPGSVGDVPCRSCPLNGTPCIYCGRGFLTKVNGSQGMPQLIRPKLGGGWLAEGEVEGLSKVCTKVKRCSRGRFGEVWLGRMSEDGSNGSSTREVAIKVFPEAERKSWETELELYRLPRLKHPNILHFVGIDKVTRAASEESDGENRSGGGSGCGDSDTPLVEYWLVTDYLAHGSVYDYIKQHEISWGQMLWIAVGMARGLSYLHTELPRTATQYPKPSIAHRDFKSRNVLLKADLTPCISDLGLASRLETGRSFGDAHLQVGTARYMAPEVLDGAIQFTRDAFLRIDVYALGLVIWELMTRAHGPAEEDEDSSTTDGARMDETRAPKSLPPYSVPFEAELGPNPSMEKLQYHVAKHRNRPQPRPWWKCDPAFRQLWETVQDSWDHDAEARITAGCIAGRIQNLSQRYPPSASDPAHDLPFLAPPPSRAAGAPLAASANPEALPLLPPHSSAGAAAGGGGSGGITPLEV